MKQLIIAEKPSVAIDISEALGGGFLKASAAGQRYLERDDLIISSAFGHLLGITCPIQQDPGNDIHRLPVIPTHFVLTPREKSQQQLDLLKHLISRRDVESVINACDAGREGELIFRYIASYCQCQKPIYRLWLQSMTHAAILTAFDEMQPATTRDGLYQAAQSRSEADWLIGINGSRAVNYLHQLTRPTSTKITIGRVQTPTLAFVVDRELAIKNFVAKDYYEIIASIGQGLQSYQAKWIDRYFQPTNASKDAKAERVFSRDQAEALAAKCRGHNPSSITDEVKPITTLPPRLFDLTTLQREANKKHGLTAQQTLTAAQSLYETHKVLTYPRTDATALPEDYVQTVINTLNKLGQPESPYAEFVNIAIANVREDKRVFNNDKITDHFAIVPTGKLPASLSADETRIFDLVVRRFLAVFYPPAQHQQTIRTTIINEELFRASGRVLVAEGWMSIYGKEVDDDEKQSALCNLLPGQTLPVTGITIASLKTKPPLRYTEASLLGAMESAGADIDDEELREAMKERGLGTPATRAKTIEHLLEPSVAYMVRQKKDLLPTQKAIELITLLRSHGLDFLTMAQTTGEWEFALRRMEEGKVTRQAFMAGIHEIARHIVAQIKQILPASATSLPEIPTPCPRCSQSLTVDHAKLSCQCGFTFWRTIAGLRLTDEQCTNLLTNGSLPPIPGFVSTKGKGREFSAGLKLADDLTGKVDFIFDTQDNTPWNDTGEAFPCPSCSKPMRKRNKGNSIFWGCSGYPNCKKTLPDENGKPRGI